MIVFGALECFWITWFFNSAERILSGVSDKFDHSRNGPLGGGKSDILFFCNFGVFLDIIVLNSAETVSGAAVQTPPNYAQES